MRVHLSKAQFTIVGLFIALLCTGCAPWNCVTRSASTKDWKMASDAEIAAKAPGDSPYIESNGANGPKYGCSFIEFDGKGGVLDYNQYQHATEVLKKRAASSNVLLVLYCHGWNNNAQSTDVINFVGFLPACCDQ